MAVLNKKQIQMSQQASDVQTEIINRNGRRIATCDGPNGSALDFYTLAGRVIIVQDHANNQGVEVYTSTEKNNLKSIYTEFDELCKG